MKDILEREIKIGDIVAHGQRSGNGGDISVKIVTATRKHPSRWNSDVMLDEVFVRGYVNRRYKYDPETNTGEWVDGIELQKGGWTTGDRLVVITESVPKATKEFLQNETR